MKTAIFLAVLASATMLAGCHTPSAAARVNLAGQWHWVCCDGKYQGELTLQQTGGKITGRLFDENDTKGGAIAGSIDGNTVRFTRSWADNLKQNFILALSADGKKLEGQFDGTQDAAAGTHFESTRK